jgi:hypothetical protein
MSVRWGYVCTGAPPSTAFTPVPARNSSVFSYKGSLSGQPGTRGVPCGLPEFGQQGLQANGVRLRGGGAGYNAGSDTMPLVWYPQQYYQATLLAPGEEASFAGGVSIWSDNQMPVPAADPLGRAAVLAKPATFLGQYDIPQPQQGPKPAWWKRVIQSSGYAGPGS